ncbi:MAG: hypothetical protein AB8F34_04835 [Akkermansiaceae bacterium]
MAHFFLAQQLFLQFSPHFPAEQQALPLHLPQQLDSGAEVAHELRARAPMASMGMTDNWITFFI